MIPPSMSWSEWLGNHLLLGDVGVRDVDQHKKNILTNTVKKKKKKKPATSRLMLLTARLSLIP